MKPRIEKHFHHMPLPPPPYEPRQVLITFQGKAYIASSVAEWKKQYLNNKGELREDTNQDHRQSA